MTPERISIQGLRELNRNLAALERTLPTATRLACNSAAELVVAAAKPRVPIGPDKGGHASSSIKAKSTRTAARVAEGGKRFPYMPWLDFGGRVGRHNTVSRPFMKSGRFVWAAFGENRDAVQEQLINALTDVVRSAGFEDVTRNG